MIWDRPPTSFAALSENRKDFLKMWHLTCDTWHMTCDTWHVTHDIWHMTRDRCWSCTFSQNVSFLALTVWKWRFVEDIFTKDHWPSWIINQLHRCLLNWPGSVKYSLKRNSSPHCLHCFCISVLEMLLVWNSLVSLQLLHIGGGRQIPDHSKSIQHWNFTHFTNHSQELQPEFLNVEKTTFRY